MRHEDFDLGDALPFLHDGEDRTENLEAVHAVEFDLASLYLEAIGASDDPPEQQTAASMAIENGGSISKRSGNTEVAEDAANRNQKQFTDPSCPAFRRVLHLTVFPNIYGQEKREYEVTFPEIADLYRETHARHKKNLPYWKLATFGSHRTSGNSLRNNANMVTIDGIEVDYDGGKISFDEACHRCREAGLAALIYPTPSHKPEAPRYRMLCPTSKELPVSERDALVARINGVMGGVLDGASFTDSQAMSFGHVSGKEVRVELVEGRFIDEAADLDAGAIGRTGRKKRAKKPRNSSGMPIPNFSLEDARHVLAAIPLDWWDDYYNWFRALCAMHYQFGGSEAAYEVVTQYCRQSDRFDELGQREKWDSITHETENPTTMASMIAVANEARREKQRAGIAAEFNDDPDEQGSAPDFYSELQMSKSGPLGNLFNAMMFLKRDPTLVRIVAYDRMRLVPMLQRPIPGTVEVGVFPRPLRDTDTTALEEYLQRMGLRTVSDAVAHRALLHAAEQNGFHPLQDYLQSLEWDGVLRLDDWLATYLRAEASPYVRAVGRMFLIQMVARVLRPGCKGDYMLILESPDQGEGKSTVCEILAGKEYFSDSLPKLEHEKDAMQHLRGKWLLEIAEMAAMSRSDADQIKHFVSKTSDRFRPSYGRNEVTNHRQCVFVGTTNRDNYLRDETGARRFWPVTVGSVDLDALKYDRDQLFAEAVVAFKAGEHWWPSREFEREHMAAQQEMRQEGDPWEPVIERYVEDQDRVTTLEIARLALQIPTERLGTAQQRRIGACMIRLGWSRLKSNGNRYFVRSTKRRAS